MISRSARLIPRVSARVRPCSTASAQGPSRIHWFSGGTAFGLLTGGFAGYEIAKKRFDFKDKVRVSNYKHSLAGQLGKQVGQDDLTNVLSDERVKGAFSLSEVKQLYTVLPKWDISLWEFKNALNKLESAELHYRAPEPVEAKLHKVGKAMPKGREQWHLSRTIKDEEATMLFRMFDLNGDGRIQASEMITVFAVFAKADTEEDKKERARLLFRIWDQDGDGEITRKEMREGYKKMNAHAGKGIAGRTLTSVFFHFADKNGDGKISEQEFVDDPKLVDRVMFAMTNSHYQKFLNKEDFPELARCLTESYHELRK